jgi:hypothetical protein
MGSDGEHNKQSMSLLIVAVATVGMCILAYTWLPSFTFEWGQRIYHWRDAPKVSTPPSCAFLFQITD